MLLRERVHYFTSLKILYVGVGAEEIHGGSHIHRVIYNYGG